MRRVGFVIGIGGLLLWSAAVFGQTFGKNKVQYHRMTWSYLRSEHFDVYFYEGGQEIATFAADIAESSYVALKRSWGYDLQERISLIVYNSHNDFEGTNVTMGIPEESVGGFTEFLKNRVVVPYQGSYREFRHVIHHELTHAVMFQMLYGTGVGSILYGAARLQLPLWYAEGMAEFESLGWDTEADMWARDATIGQYLAPIEYLGGYLAYKGGQSVFEFISKRYGREKVGEILREIRARRSVKKGFLAALGLSPSELSKKWHKYLEKTYFPEVGKRQEPEDFAKRLTDHEKLGNFVNHSPAISPVGGRIAFISDQEDYFDIYLISTYTGEILTKLVKGQRSERVEEMHWLRPGISWSPDGHRIVFAAKAGGKDVLHIWDVEKRKRVRTIRFNLDGVFSPSWSPDGERIVFVGMRRGQSDIYVIQLSNGIVSQLTDDLFTDLEPSWSPDGHRIAFASDRGDSLYPGPIRMSAVPYGDMDIYVMNTNGSERKRVIHSTATEKTPVWSPNGDILAYTSDRNGIQNIYLHDLNTGSDYPITDVLTGCAYLSWSGDGKRMAFASLYKGGYDIYLLKDPLSLPSRTLAPTAYLAAKTETAPVVDTLQVPLEKGTQRRLAYGGLSHFIFDDRFLMRGMQPAEPESVALNPEVYQTPQGTYKVSRYQPKLKLDILSGGAGYDPFFGFQGGVQLGMSDMLGDYKVFIAADLIRELQNSNYLFMFQYLPRRIDYMGGVFHFVNFYQTSGGIVRFREFGTSLWMSYPYSKFTRVDVGINGLYFEEQFLYTWEHPANRFGYLLNLGLTNDTTIWGMTGPINGERSYVNIIYSPNLGREAITFTTVLADWRHYHRLGKDIQLAVRLAGGFSEGRNATKFLLGGVDSWINYRFKRNLEEGTLTEAFLSQFLAPLRGADYYECIGTRGVLANAELRFPFVRYFLFGWPFAFGFQNIRGALFSDAGAVWDQDEPFRFALPKGPDSTEEGKVVWGYGMGARLNLGIFLLRFDMAWRKYATVTSKPLYYFSLGLDF